MNARLLLPFLPALLLASAAAAQSTAPALEGSTLAYEITDPAVGPAQLISDIKTRLGTTPLQIATPAPNQLTLTFPYAEPLRRTWRDLESALAASQAAAPGLPAPRLLDLLDHLAAQPAPEAAPARDRLLTRYPHSADALRNLFSAHAAWVAAGGLCDRPGPRDIERQLTPAALEFRIAVNALDLGSPDGDDFRAALQSLDQHGPDRPLNLRALKARWIHISPGSESDFRNGATMLVSIWFDQPFVLCFDSHEKTLTHTDPERKPWRVQAGTPADDPNGLSLPFSLDTTGAQYLGDLSGSNIGRHFVIIVNDKALTAPILISKISKGGLITFGPPTADRPLNTLRREAQELRAQLNRAPLPLRRLPSP